MARLDRDVVQKVLDTADIVDVVSDFVTLKKSGANYMGLCPFHNERTPSFSVSPSRGICKCFSCGKGGSPVNFIMEHEQLTFPEAIRYLAAKYHIEIRERELTEEERRQQSLRENIFAVNDFAMRHYQELLLQSDEGRNFGQSYFRHRGISPEMIQRFKLGYSLEKGDLHIEAMKKGYSEGSLLDSGLCLKNDSGRIYDRFRGRVIFPVFTISGKIIAFGARTLKTEKTIAKYVNSPETEIYKKRRELYGFYQAKSSIAKLDKCILVEGYLDVISMHQAGITNVVASSGTSLTSEQIVMIRRFTPNITVIYDSDSAGVKATLRSIDMLLSAGMSIKILTLPEGEDPDSFAQNNSSSVVKEYLDSHEIDFIKFQTNILVRGTENDPMARAKAISEIVTSISAIPDQIARNIYVKECASAFGIGEKTILNQIARTRAGKPAAPTRPQAPENAEPQPVKTAPVVNPISAALRPYELEITRLALRYSMLQLCDAVDEEGNTTSVTVLDYILSDLEADNITFSNSDISRTLTRAKEIADKEFPPALEKEIVRLESLRTEDYNSGVESIREEAKDMDEICKQEKVLIKTLDEQFNAGIEKFKMQYIAKILSSDDDDNTRRLATEALIERHTLSKIYSRYAHIETDQERLNELVPRAIYELKDAILELRINKQYELMQLGSDFNECAQAIQQLKELRQQLSPLIGERVIAPK